MSDITTPARAPLPVEVIETTGSEIVPATSTEVTVPPVVPPELKVAEGHPRFPVASFLLWFLGIVAVALATLVGASGAVVVAACVALMIAGPLLVFSEYRALR